MDEAFLSLPDLLPGLLPSLPDLVDESSGVKTTVVGLDVTTPVELGIEIAADGTILLSGAPPLYHVETSFLPVLHRISLVTKRDGAAS